MLHVGEQAFQVSNHNVLVPGMSFQKLRKNVRKDPVHLRHVCVFCAAFDEGEIQGILCACSAYITLCGLCKGFKMAALFAEMASIIGVLEKTAAPAAAEAGDNKEAELVEMLIAMRQDARKSKNYALADELRNKLGAIGIVLQDTPQGVKWSKQ